MKSFIANIITCARIICALSLIFCPTFSIWFYVLYIVGGVSDVLDGMTARKLGKETKLGAQLDTAADVVFTAVVIIKTVRAISVPIWLLVWIVCIAVIKISGVIMGFVIYKRFISEHTKLNKICGLLLFAIPFYIGRFPWQTLVMVMICHCCVATVAAVQEGYYILTGKTIG